MTNQSYDALLSVPQVAQIVGRDAQTIRNWTSEFREAFSVSASINENSNGRHRFYNREDIAKLLMIREFREARYRAEEIVMALANEQNWAKYLDMVDNSNVALQIMDTQSKRMEIDFELMSRELTVKEEELAKLRQLVQESHQNREENIQLKTQMQSIQNELANIHRSYQQQLELTKAQIAQAAEIYLGILRSKDNELAQKNTQVQELLTRLADKSEAIGKASAQAAAMQRELEKVESNYSAYYQNAEWQLEQMRQALAAAQAELAVYRKLHGDDAAGDNRQS